MSMYLAGSEEWWPYGAATALDKELYSLEQYTQLLLLS